MSDSQSTNLCLDRNPAIGKAPLASASSPANRAGSRALLDRAEIPLSLSSRRESGLRKNDHPITQLRKFIEREQRAICRIRSCSPAAAPPPPWRNRETPVSFCKASGKIASAPAATISLRPLDRAAEILNRSRIGPRNQQKILIAFRRHCRRDLFFHVLDAISDFPARCPQRLGNS